MSKNRILFVCKNRELPYTSVNDTDEYSEAYCDKKSSGLLNSVKFVAAMLLKSGVDCKVVDVVDNNCIDKEVTLYNPTHVIIEALWVVPSKFAILSKLHPKVKWIIRLHSELPFIAGEGNAMDWIYEYSKYESVSIACNSKRIAEDLEFLIKKSVSYMPNFYDLDSTKTKIINPIVKSKQYIDVGCFGAIRPLKNQLIQAVASMEFATNIGKKLKFHINGSRVEGKGDNNLKNIRKLFEKNIHGHELIEHDWMAHEVFVGLLSQMDILLQVSFTETYNIVAADAISQDVPVVTSNEIPFVFSLFKADCTNTKSIWLKMFLAYYLDKIGFSNINYFLLLINSKHSRTVWMKLFK